MHRNKHVEALSPALSMSDGSIAEELSRLEAEWGSEADGAEPREDGVSKRMDELDAEVSRRSAARRSRGDGP